MMCLVQPWTRSQTGEAQEIQYIKDKEVWRRILQQEALRRGYKIVKGRWINVNKGDSTN